MAGKPFLDVRGERLGDGRACGLSFDRFRCLDHSKITLRAKAVNRRQRPALAE